MREHSAEEVAHYSCGTADIEYAFPFLPAGEFGELEGVAHRADFDLRSHQEGKLVKQGGELVVEMTADGKPRHKGSGKKLKYKDEVTKEPEYYPHVIEPSAGADRATLAFLCEAYCEDTAPDEHAALRAQLRLRILQLRRIYPATDEWLTAVALARNPTAVAEALAGLETNLAARLTPSTTTTGDGAS